MFIDSNIWLDLYHYSNNDLIEFSKLQDSIEVDYCLFVTDQVVNEVLRNRDAKVADAYKQFKDIKIKTPNICKGYEEYKTFELTLKTVYTLHRDLCKKLDEDIYNEKLHADIIINALFVKARRIHYTQEIMEAAKTRYSLGNPPGKNNSNGDAVNWESLLAAIPNGEDVFFISEDKDFISALNGQNICSYLNKEWTSRKGSKIFFYTSLSAFFNEHLKAISLKTEEEKNRQIALLFNVGNFRNAHSIIARLSTYSYFSDEQTNVICQAAASTNQIWGIISDDDINEFYRGILKGREEIVRDDETLQWLYNKIFPEKRIKIDDDESSF